MDRERTSAKEREREPRDVIFYEAIMSRLKDRREIARTGRIVLKREDFTWQQTRQGKIGFYMLEEIADTALKDWRVFAHEIHTHSGRHTHQGGIVIYVTRGTGYTVVNGVKEHWKAGDLIVLPILPGGVEHQHWNEDPNDSSEWVAFRFVPWQYATGATFDQNEVSPNWKG